MALGIGLTTASFSIVYGLILRGLPFPHGDRIVAVTIENRARKLDEQLVDIHDFLDWRARQRSFSGLAGMIYGTVALSDDGPPDRLDGAELTADALGVLEVTPYLGRGFLPGEDRAGTPPVVLLGYDLWRDRYHGDRQMIGRPVRVNGQATTVVGVMPPGFAFPTHAQLWTPHLLDPAASERGGGDTLVVFGRLRPEVSLSQAQAEMATISERLAVELPATNGGWTARVERYTDQWIGDDARLLWAMFGAVCCVLVLASINVAGLVLARSLQRTREVAMRFALGAERKQVIRQMLTESLLLAILGALAGLILAWLAVREFNLALVTANFRLAFWARIAIDAPAFAFALAVTVLATVASGVVPALQISRTPLGEVLKDESRGATSLRLGRLTRGIVIAELALSCVLLVAAGLMIKSILRSRSADYGFVTQHSVMLRVALFEARYPAPADRAAFYTQLEARLRELPGVEAVGASTSLPSVGGWHDLYLVDGRAYASPADHPHAHLDTISAGFFAALGARPVEGREFTRFDTLDAQPVAMVNASLARQQWPHESAIGKRIRLENASPPAPWRTVVGVIPDLRLHGVTDKLAPAIFSPVAQAPPAFLSFVIRSAGDPLALIPQVRTLVASLDRDTPVYFVKTLERAIFEERFYNDLIGAVFTVFGLAALALAAVGIYSVMSFAVGRRAPEIALRMAVGARPGAVFNMLLRQVLLQLAAGLAIGLPAAFVVARMMSTALFEVEPGDPGVYLLVALMLSAVAFATCLVPALRALRLDLHTALRAA